MIYTQLGEPYVKPGATCNFLKGVGAYAGSEGKNIILDCGVGFRQAEGRSETYAPEIDKLDGTRVDLIVVSHCHADHIIAAIPLAMHHPEAEIVMSRPTSLSGWINATDTLKIARQNQRNALRYGLKLEPLLFDEDELNDFFERAVILDHPQWVSPWDGWEIGFHNCGHTRGAKSTFILPPHGRPIYHTGDTCRHNQELTDGVLVPSDDFLGDFLKRKGVVLITETTNGAKPYTQKDRELQKELILKKAREVEGRGGQMFHPTFAEGRSATLASIYTSAGIHVHVDGLAREFLRVYAEPDSLWCEEDRPFPLQGLIDQKLLTLFEEDYHVAKDHRMMADRGYDGCSQFPVIISPSATMEKGFAVQHAMEILPQVESCCMFAGYVFANTPSAELVKMSDPTTRVERGRTIKLNGVPVNVRCEIARVGLTGHDGAEALVDRAKIVAERSQEAIVIGHHGDEENRGAFAQNVRNLGITYLDGLHMVEHVLD